MKKTITYSLSLILLFCLSVTSCQDDMPGSLKGTTWEFSKSGSEALEWYYIPDRANASITYTATIQFTTDTEFRFIDRIKGVAYGETVNEVIESLSGTYIYGENNDIVTLCFESCVDAKISKNTLTITEEGETIVFVKK